MPNNNPQSPPQPSGRAATSSKIAERIEQTADQTSKLADKLGQTAEDQASAAIQHLRDVGEQARAGIEQQRAQVASRVRRIGDALRSGSVALEREDELASNVLNMAVAQLDNVASYIDELSPRGLAGDIQSVARTRPGLFFGAAFLVGLGFGRFVKSSGGGGQEVERTAAAARRGAWGEQAPGEQTERSKEPSAAESKSAVSTASAEPREGTKS
jgi:hypothetical protein